MCKVGLEGVPFHCEFHDQQIGSWNVQVSHEMHGYRWNIAHHDPVHRIWSKLNEPLQDESTGRHKTKFIFINSKVR